MLRSGSLSSQSDITSKWAIKEGDIVCLRALNGHLLSIGSGGKLVAGNDHLKQAVSKDSDMALGDAFTEKINDPPDHLCEFVIHRLGIDLITQNTSTIRRNVAITLKPVRTDPNEEEVLSDYIKVAGNGDLLTHGKITDKEITLIIDQVSLKQSLEPLNKVLIKGDAEIRYTQLSNKSEPKRAECLSGTWCTAERLKAMTGIVVVTDELGQYAQPKGNEAWVAVIVEGVSIVKAAQQAMLQGATGLVVKCNSPWAMERRTDAGPKVVLPTVFVNQEVGQQLSEVGLDIVRCDVKRQYVTELQKTIVRFAFGEQGTLDPKEVFLMAGRAQLEFFRETQRQKVAKKAKELADAAAAQVHAPTAQGPSGGGKYKWKIASKGEYLWAGSRGGKMEVNWGSAVPPPPSANVFQDPLQVDTGFGKKSTPLEDPKTRRITFTNKRTASSLSLYIPDEDVRAMKLADEMAVMVKDSGEAEREELPAESDFKIEYHFEEVFVDENASMEDLIEDQDLMDDDGAELGAIGIRFKYFWAFILAQFLFSMALFTFFFWLLQTDEEVVSRPNMPPPDVDWGEPGAPPGNSGVDVAGDVEALLFSGALSSFVATAVRRLMSAALG